MQALHLRNAQTGWASCGLCFLLQAGTATHYLDKQYLDTTEMSFKIGAAFY